MHRSLSAVFVINNPGQDGNFNNNDHDENNFVAEDVQIHFLQYPPAPPQLQVGLYQACPGPLQRLSLGPEVSNNLVTCVVKTSIIFTSHLTSIISYSPTWSVSTATCCARLMLSPVLARI